MTDETIKEKSQQQ